MNCFAALIMSLALSQGAEPDMYAIEIGYGEPVVVMIKGDESEYFYVVNAACHPIAFMHGASVGVARVESIEELRALLKSEGYEVEGADQSKSLAKSKWLDVKNNESYSAFGFDFGWSGNGPRTGSLFIQRPKIDGKYETVKFCRLAASLDLWKVSKDDFEDDQMFRLRRPKAAQQYEVNAPTKYVVAVNDRDGLRWLMNKDAVHVGDIVTWDAVLAADLGIRITNWADIKEHVALNRVPGQVRFDDSTGKNVKRSDLRGQTLLRLKIKSNPGVAIKFESTGEGKLASGEFSIADVEQEK